MERRCHRVIHYLHFEIVVDGLDDLGRPSGGTCFAGGQQRDHHERAVAGAGLFGI